MARKPDQAPAIEPHDGLRQRQRGDGSWRLWWEPTRRQAAAGAKVVEFSIRTPGLAQREATRLTSEWNARIAGKPMPIAPGGRSVSALIQDYRTSLAWTRLAETTQRAYQSDLVAIDEKWGPQPVSLFDEAMMDLWYESLHSERGVWRAGSILGTMRRLMKHAEKRKWRPRGTNPCREMEIERGKPRRRTGTWEELDAILRASRVLGLRSMRLAILLAVFSGQRQTDLRLARPDAFRPFDLPGGGRPVWVWTLTRNKRGNEGHIPMHPEIVPALRVQLLIVGQGPGTLMWDEATGRAFETKDQVFKRWETIRNLAAKTQPSVATLQWRDLRRTFGALSRGGGATKSDVADVLGNTADQNPMLTETYMAAQLITSLRATSAIQRPAPVKPALKERKKA